MTKRIKILNLKYNNNVNIIIAKKYIKQMITKNNFYIITGGPGVGKTTLLEGLQQEGFNSVSEVARPIIKEQMETGGDALPWMDTRKYSDLMLSRSVDDFLRLLD